VSVETVSQLLSQGRAAASVGENIVAESLFRRATQIEPDNVAAWLALSAVVSSLAEKRRCLERVRSLDPGNEEAKAALAWVARKEADSADPSAFSAPARPVPTAPVTKPDAPPAAPEAPMYCANHPSVETVLRCNRCGKPICTRCAVRTPVGFRCPQCVREQRSTFYVGGTGDYVIAAVVALVLSLPAAFLIAQLGWFFAIFLGPVAGGIIAEAVRLATGKRRARWTWLIVGGSMVVGAFPTIVMVGVGFGLIGLLVYLVLGVGAASARLR
jgi:hypothetical protein